MRDQDVGTAGGGEAGEYGAPWGRMQKVVTLLVLGLLGVGMSAGVAGMRHPSQAVVPAAVIAAVVILSLLSMVRGYRVTTEALLIRRPTGFTRVPLAGLRSVEPGGEVLGGSIRLFGNGGFFSMTGWYWNRRLGRYRLFLNDPTRAVVLRFADRVVVVGPSDPVGFANRVSKGMAGKHHG